MMGRKIKRKERVRILDDENSEEDKPEKEKIR